MTEDITEALQREIPTLYLDRADDAYYVAEAIAYSDWLAAHDAEVAARARKEALREAAEAVEAVEEVDAWTDADGGDTYWTIDPEPFANAIRALEEGGGE